MNYSTLFGFCRSFFFNNSTQPEEQAEKFYLLISHKRTQLYIFVVFFFYYLNGTLIEYLCVSYISAFFRWNFSLAAAVFFRKACVFWHILPLNVN